MVVVYLEINHTVEVHFEDKSTTKSAVGNTPLRDHVKINASFPDTNSVEGKVNRPV